MEERGMKRRRKEGLHTLVPAQTFYPAPEGSV
jgi:hypothetical protein